MVFLCFCFCWLRCFVVHRLRKIAFAPSHRRWKRSWIETQLRGIGCPKLEKIICSSADLVIWADSSSKQRCLVRFFPWLLYHKFIFDSMLTLLSFVFLTARHVRSDPRSPYWQQLQLSKHWIQLMFVLWVQSLLDRELFKDVTAFQWCSMFNHPLDLVVLPGPRSPQWVTMRHFAKSDRRKQEVEEKNARPRKVGEQKGNG